MLRGLECCDYLLVRFRALETTVQLHGMGNSKNVSGLIRSVAIAVLSY
jgi:hypothetical protein